MSIETFKRSIESSGAIDPVGVHHEFREGAHGRKIDFDAVNDSTELLKEWASEVAQYIASNYQPLPQLIVSVANGANKVVPMIAAGVAGLTGESLEYILTNKLDGSLQISKEDKIRAESLRSAKALVIDDVGTTGSNSVSVCHLLMDLGVKDVEVLYTWQRTEALTRLADTKIPHRSMIVDYTSVQTYDPNNCQHCHDGWALIPYKR